jgi:hypothetical protein
MRGDLKSKAVRWQAAAAFAGLALFAAGCADGPYGSGGQRYFIPWPDAPGNYRMQPVQINTLDHPDSLTGQLVKFYVNPYAVGGDLAGGEPIGRYVRDANDVLHPADLLTRSATTIYAHMERLQALDVAAGGASLMRWPARLGLRTLMREAMGDLVNNNAIYDPEFDAILLVPYTQNGLPIVENGGVIGHEHFHALFYAMVGEPLAVAAGRKPVAAAIGGHEWEGGSSASVAGVDRSSAAARPVGRYTAMPNSATALSSVDELNDFTLRGINEGLADSWGWFYSGDPGFVGRSLPATQAARALDVAPEPIVEMAAWRIEVAQVSSQLGLSPVDRQQLLLGHAYRIGTQYARFMRAMALALGNGVDSPQARLLAAQALVRALPALKDAVQAAYLRHQPIDPQIGALVFARALKVATASACEIYESVVSQASRLAAPTACANLAERAESAPAPSIVRGEISRGDGESRDL